MRRRASALILATVIGGPLQAQRPVPTITLDKGAKEFAEPFSVVSSVVELRDGRLLVYDSKDKAIHLVDVDRGLTSPAARSGSGPLEFQTGMLLATLGDTVLYYDMMQRRLLVFSPAGTPARTVLFGGTDPTSFMSLMQPIITDAAGRAYGQSMGMSMPGASARAGAAVPSVQFADTVAIERFDPRTLRRDTITRVGNFTKQTAPKMDMGPNGMRMSIAAPNFDPSDVWTVLPNGTVALLRGGEYRVRFLTGIGREELGPVIPYTKVPVTAQMRREVMDSLRARMKVMQQQLEKNMADSRAAAAGAGIEMPKMQFEVREPVRWADALPAYSGITAAPAGRLWVSTPTAFEALAETTSRYDVLDESGALIARVVLAKGERVAGHGRGTLYTIRTDADDLQYLRKHVLPAPLRRDRQP